VLTGAWVPKVRRPVRPGSCDTRASIINLEEFIASESSPTSAVQSGELWKTVDANSCDQKLDTNAGYQPYSPRAIPTELRQDGLPPSLYVIKVLRTDDAQAGQRGDAECLGEQFDKSDFFCRVIPER
jgi:hypothetical protein